jgi:hypothetical protein
MKLEERIAEELDKNCWYEIHCENCGATYMGKAENRYYAIPQILSLVREEVKSVLNPAPFSTRSAMERLARESFENCREAILKVLGSG